MTLLLVRCLDSSLRVVTRGLVNSCPMRSMHEGQETLHWRFEGEHLREPELLHPPIRDWLVNCHQRQDSFLPPLFQLLQVQAVLVSLLHHPTFRRWLLDSDNEEMLLLVALIWKAIFLDLVDFPCLPWLFLISQTYKYNWKDWLMKISNITVSHDHDHLDRELQPVISLLISHPLSSLRVVDWMPVEFL